jgi:hypothetical protein
MPVWLWLLLGGGAVYLLTRSSSAATAGATTAPIPSPYTTASFTVGQTAYTNAVTALTVSAQDVVNLQPGTRVYVQTADASGQTQIRTDSGNVGTVPTSSLSPTLPAGTTMQVN